jgi:tRNA pseudouridine55 synthase
VSKVGHAGTLDPFATGLLVVLVGRATKLARFLVDLPKEYVCTMKFGVSSDTGDLTGMLVETGANTTRQRVEAVLPRFLGSITQRVPMTSAAKVDGERLYKKAHRGEIVETPVKEVEITAIDVLTFDEAAQTMRCRVACSKGTYVRQLAIDIGAAVGVGAHLEELARTAIGDLRLEDAQDLSDFREAVSARAPGDERIPGLVSPGAALAFMPSIELPAAQVPAVRNGARLPGGQREAVRLTYRGELLAVYGPADEGHVLKLLVKL